MKAKHFSLSVISAILLFSCGLQPAFTQRKEEPCTCAQQFVPIDPPKHKVAAPELGVKFVDLQTGQSRRFYCVAAEKLEVQEDAAEQAK